MSSPAPQGTPQPKVVVVDEESPSCEFSRWPLRDETVASVIVLAVIVLVSIALGYFGGSFWWGVVAILALLVSQWRMWIKVEYQLCDLGVIQTVWNRTWRRPWDAFAGYEVRHEGVLLPPEEDSSTLGRLKGLYISFGTNRDDILGVVSRHLPQLDEYDSQ